MLKKQVLEACPENLGDDIAARVKRLFRAAYEWAHKGHYRGKLVAQAISVFHRLGEVPAYVLDFLSGGHHLALKAA
jgi:hypothetical protein